MLGCFLSVVDSTNLMMYKEFMALSSINSWREDGFGSRPDHGLFPISVVTELTGVSAPTLRGFERAGLVAPARTDGGSRRYSQNDLARLRRITALVGDGVNLAGIRRIIELEHESAELRAELAELRRRHATTRPDATPPGSARGEQERSGFDPRPLAAGPE